jgi:uncharacterized protein with HEPN domain
MLSRTARDALVDIRFNVVLIEDFVWGFDFETFERELKTVNATTRALEIISEASRRLPDELKARHPGRLWKQMQSAGNRSRHNDDGVEASLIWRTAHDSLPPLMAVVEAELAAADLEGRQESTNP